MLRWVGALGLMGCVGSEVAKDAETGLGTGVDTDASPRDSDTGPTNQPPSVEALTADRLALVGQAVRVAFATSDADGDAVTLAWSTEGRPARVLPIDATHAFVVPSGVGELRVIATPSDGGSDGMPAVVTLTVHDLDAGQDHGVALMPDGALFSYGDNLVGTVGDGSGRNQLSAVRVCDVDAVDCDKEPLRNIVAVSAGLVHSLALTADGRVFAWGGNDDGQLGNGSRQERTRPVPVCGEGEVVCGKQPLRDIVSVKAGDRFSLALRDDGAVFAWGRGAEGQLGDGGTPQRSTPAPVCGVGAPDGGCLGILKGVVAIAAGGDHALALRGDGSLVGWGFNASGQVGQGDSSVSVIGLPTMVCGFGETAPCTRGPANLLAIDAWGRHSVALRRDGTALAWGRNSDVQLSSAVLEPCDDLSACAQTPVLVCATSDARCSGPLDAIAQIQAGLRFSFALRDDGSVWAWGANDETQLGDGTLIRRPRPVRVCAPGEVAPCTSFLDDVAGIAGGSYHSLALRSDGSVWGWGDNPFADRPEDIPLTNPVPLRLRGY